MLSGVPERRLDLLAEGLRTAARLARHKAVPGVALEESTHDEAIIFRALDTFANELDSVAFRLEEMADGLMKKLV